MEIKVLGPGCSKCKKTEEIVRQVVAEEGITANIEKVTDIMQIAGYGVLGTPAIIINGEVKSVGKIPKKEEIKTWIGK
ncbi:MAG: TM0996/MTH895 family glutaredoxin-like protein [Proteobacteria bacterium]|nr:TM0996/MTH895 family glutaredoxin-like protein [Pseudomonadota bacterium]